MTNEEFETRKKEIASNLQLLQNEGRESPRFQPLDERPTATRGG